MAKGMLNGNLKTVIGIVSLLAIGATLVAGYVKMGGAVEENKAHNAEHVVEVMAEFDMVAAEDDEQWADIDANSEYIDKNSVDMSYIKRDISTMQGDISGMKESIDDFAEEQRSMNLKILDRLPE